MIVGAAFDSCKYGLTILGIGVSSVELDSVLKKVLASLEMFTSIQVNNLSGVVKIISILHVFQGPCGAVECFLMRY